MGKGITTVGMDAHKVSVSVAVQFGADLAQAWDEAPGAPTPWPESCGAEAAAPAQVS
jgi:hypothetical protein